VEVVESQGGHDEEHGSGRPDERERSGRPPATPRRLDLPDAGQDSCSERRRRVDGRERAQELGLSLVDSSGGPALRAALQMLLQPRFFRRSQLTPARQHLLKTIVAHGSTP
jgi:hypothetical protein